MVAINHFPTDTDEEIAVVEEHCDVARPARRCVAKPFSAGGEGCRELAEAVWTVAQASAPALQAALRVERSDREEDRHDRRARCTAPRRWTTARARGATAPQLEKLGYDKLPVCIAKTQQSLSDNPALLGRPKDFLVTVREIQLAAGAGFIVPITGEILRMPGLPTHPLAEQFDLSDERRDRLRRLGVGEGGRFLGPGPPLAV